MCKNVINAYKATLPFSCGRLDCCQLPRVIQGYWQLFCKIINIVFIKYCVFFQEFSKVCLPRQHSAAIGCTKIHNLIGMTVHSYCVESIDGLLQLCRRGCSKCGKKHNFSWTPCISGSFSSPFICWSKIWEFKTRGMPDWKCYIRYLEYIYIIL